jgi:hypothetical protein
MNTFKPKKEFDVIEESDRGGTDCDRLPKELNLFSKKIKRFVKEFEDSRFVIDENKIKDTGINPYGKNTSVLKLTTLM